MYASSGSGGGTLTRIVNVAGGIDVGLSGAGHEDSGVVYEESIVATWNLRCLKDWGEVKGVFKPMKDNKRNHPGVNKHSSGIASHRRTARERARILVPPHPSHTRRYFRINLT